MTAGELAFLSLGLLFGVVGGAGLIEMMRGRMRSPREIRLTVTPDSASRRRASTFADDAFSEADVEASRPGPDNMGKREAAGSVPVDRPTVSGHGRTAVRSATAGGAVGVPIHREADTTLEALRAAAAGLADEAIQEQRINEHGLQGVAVEGQAIAVAAVVDRPGAEDASGLRPGAPDASRPLGTGVGDARTTGAVQTSVGPPIQATAEPVQATAEPVVEPSGDRDELTGQLGDCGEVRRVADERCAVATRARNEARVAQETLRAAQRSYDDHQARADQAAALSEPHAVRQAKEAAHEAFRVARQRGDGSEASETAARNWLTEINQINLEARREAAVVTRERDAAAALVATIEELVVEADASLVSAQVAESACVAAREAVADCQQGTGNGVAGGWPPIPSIGQGGGWPDALGDGESELAAAFGATGQAEPAILRMLRGDRTTVTRLVDQLAGENPTERRRWQRALTDLVDAIVARSIEACALHFPSVHPFWGGFTLAQNREIASALSSLGFRFDGIGGWADDRTPTQRDLSLAVGYAGQDPMRIRRWPNEQEMADLMADVLVAADEYLTESAGGLTLGELVDVLGRRADGLADLWNEWGRVRPLLLGGDTRS